jgi:hypothetical protein
MAACGVGTPLTETAAALALASYSWACRSFLSTILIGAPGRGGGLGRGRRVGRGLGVTLGVGVAVGLGEGLIVGVGVAVGVAVGVGVGVTGGVGVGVGVGVAVGVAVGVTVGVGVGVPPGTRKAYTLLSPATKMRPRAAMPVVLYCVPAINSLAPPPA